MAGRGSAPGPRPRHPLADVHLYLGLAAAVFLLGLAVTGIMLNHPGALGLDRGYVGQDWLLELYGIEAPASVEGVVLPDGRAVAEIDGRLYLDGEEVSRGVSTVVDAAVIGDGLIVAVQPRQISLLLPDGRLVETVQVPTTVQGDLSAARAESDGTLLVATPDAVYRTDESLLDWQVDPEAAPPRARREELPGAQAGPVRRAFLHRSLSWERVLLDLHSGRLFGRAGVWVMDLAGIALIALGITGIWLWLRRRRQQKEMLRRERELKDRMARRREAED